MVIDMENNGRPPHAAVLSSFLFDSKHVLLEFLSSIGFVLLDSSVYFLTGYYSYGHREDHTLNES